ncbi:MAG: acyl-CoA/acyl-ACP dehydrogenase [Alphaproteobacteria bacterium]|nr:acyl-CoA/acyl-ACP dehydrogenase [Alphaproteobacteria bacterium]
MHFALSEEQQALAEAARAFLAELPGPLAMAEPGQAYPEGTWTRLVEEQGWPAILVPEEAGGWGFGVLEMAVVMEEAGRALTPCPLFSTVALGLAALRAAPAAQARPHLEALAAGAVTTWTADRPVDPEGRTWRGVIDGDLADRVVLRGRDDRWWVLPADAFVRTRERGLDPTRPTATLQLTAPLDGEPLGQIDLDAAWRLRRVLQAAESVGLAQRCLDEAVDYAKVRQQFGQPIGRFQALQHLLADVCVAVEAARAATWFAAAALDLDLPDAPLAVLTAASQATEAACLAAGQSIQVHGGIGFTWEHPAHLCFKRAHATRAADPPRHLRAAFTDALLAAPAGG